MGDDRPYLEEAAGRSILELPVHWSLDDWPYFAYNGARGGNLADARVLRAVWLDEFESALRDRRHVTYTMHPEVIGRGYRMQALRSLIEELSARANVWFAPHREVAALVARGLTDRQIAETLVITEGTVGVHLANIFSKLDRHARA